MPLIRKLIPIVLCAAAAPATGDKVETVDVAPTPIVVSGVCGDALLSLDESCESCPADCQARECVPGQEHRFAVQLQYHPAFEPTAATIRLSYRTNRLSLPGTGRAQAVTSKIDFGDGALIVAAHDHEHSLRLVRAEAKTLPSTIATVAFRACQGAPRPEASDLACVVEGCVYAGGPIHEGCYCTAAAVAP